MPPPPKKRQDTTLSQGLQVIEALVQNGHGLGVTQLANHLKLPKSSTHRLLQILARVGFVQQSPATQCYSISPQIFGFIHNFATQFGFNSRFDPILSEAASRLKCSVYLSMISGLHTYVVYAAGHEGTTIQLGTHAPVYASSAGKVLVSLLPESQWALYAPAQQSRIETSYTNLDPNRFFTELKAARGLGVAWNLRETSIKHASVAAPVRESFKSVCRMAVALLIPYDDIIVYDRVTLQNEVLALAQKLQNEATPTPLGGSRSPPIRTREFRK